VLKYRQQITFTYTPFLNTGDDLPTSGEGTLSKRIRNLVLGLGAILVCLAGLLAVSSVIPEIGCGSKIKGDFKHEANISFFPVYRVNMGQSFTIKGKLTSGPFNDPCSQQPVFVSIGEDLFNREIATDDNGNFSCEAAVDVPGTFDITVTFPGDQPNQVWPASTSQKLTLSDQSLLPGTAGTSTTSSSLLPFIICLALIVVAVMAYLLFIRLKHRSGGRERLFPVWFYAILAVFTAGIICYIVMQPYIHAGYGISTRMSSNNETGDPTKIFLRFPEHFDPGVPAKINGTLWQWLPQGKMSSDNHQETCFTLKQQPVDIMVNDEIILELVTNNGGMFSGEVTIDHLGQYQVSAVFHGVPDRWKPTKTAQHVIVGSTLFLFWNSPGWLCIYGFLILLTITVDIILYRRQRESLGISFTLKGLAVILILTELTGIAFMFDHPEDDPIYRVGEYELLQFTDVSLAVPEKAVSGRPFQARGTLTADDIPLFDREIEILYTRTDDENAVVHRLATLTTDDQGKFAAEFTLKDPARYEITAVYRGVEGLFNGSRDIRMITIEGPNALLNLFRQYTWLLVAGGVLLCLGLAAGGYYLHRHGFTFFTKSTYSLTAIKQVLFGHGKKKTGIPATAGQATPEAAMTSTPGHSPMPPVHIELPQIPTAMPDVWGKDDSLIIVFSVDGSPEMLVRYSLDIEYGTGAAARAALTAAGRATQTHIFHQTGIYHIQAVLVKEVRNGYLPASRMVRIVDYREEIVHLYNEMLVTLKLKGLSLTPKMTAREVERRLQQAFPSLTSDVTSSLVSAFEEANYSLHPIARSAYEKMFTVVKEIEKQILK
jgi:hypothetical protein